MVRVNACDLNSAGGSGYLDYVAVHHPLAIAETLTIDGVVYVIEDQIFFTDHQGPVQTVLVNRCRHS